MNTGKDCRNRIRCAIDLLARRRAQSMNAAWTLLLSAGQDLCDEREKDNSRRSFKQTLKLADDLVAANDKDANRIRAIALTCLGAQCLCDRDTENAIKYFLDAESIFEPDGDKYGHAVVLFALARAYWMRQEWSKTFRYHERSQRILTHVSSDSATIYLRQLIEEEHAEAIKDWEKSPKQKPTVWGIEAKSRNGAIGVFPIFGKIPAGNPRPIPQYVTDYVEVDQFIIDDQPYRVAGGQRDKFRLNFSLEWNYITLRVDGDSMNNAGLDDGDYVILRVSAITGTDPVPNNGDIVAVALPENDAVTLKRFRRKSDQVIFEPDSTNPNHASYPFKITGEASMPFRIVGIHVATLKPL